jgi:glutamate formiminotransferase
VLAQLADACGASLLDVHFDHDHHRSVFTLAGPTPHAAEHAARSLAETVARLVDLRRHRGVHPRLGALDVVPFVSLDGSTREDARRAAVDFAKWAVTDLGLPVFLYGDADPASRSLPDARRDAFTTRPPDLGPPSPHSLLGAVAVGARPVMIAVNCVIDTGDLAVARAIARQVRERDGGFPGVRALAFPLTARRTQVSMNLVDLSRTGLQVACEGVQASARAVGRTVVEVELVGLLPIAELRRCTDEFRAWVGLGPEQTIEGRLADRADDAS